ncbi:inosine 5'-monophosphate dehydrogenase [Aquimixticola soesokkakensis]|uniref:Inosine 5'-monophosphate dehydrogenase n=1 Tax=Aquimixticola soesokkakensis TaxID=1519096 RepID=A0A1Y5TL08_9RHOB|nr:CBS domain-containing protein [Aquimixticola soesokkakensis]SLN66033.1 inosine 5'-monophosphate dehydrogenase [Aquimixticola soesokkakensis]
MIVSQILSAKSEGTETEAVFTVRPDMTIADAAELLSARRIGAVIVSEDGTHPLGILSERDIVRELGREGATVLARQVKDLMTSKLKSCTPDMSALDVLEKMSEGRFRHMPVMIGEEMVGLVSIGDVVKARLSQLSMEKDALEGMIMGH